MGSHQPARLVKHEQPGALARRQRLAVDGDDIVGGDIERRRIDHAAVDRDAALHDPFLGIAARSQPSPRQHLGDALAGFLFARRPRRSPLVRRALAIGAAPAERRALGKNLGIVFVVAPRPIGIAVKRSRIAARMLLPGTASFSRVALSIPPRTLEFRTVGAAFPGTIEFRPLTKRAIALWTVTLGTILTRTRKPRTLIAAAILTRLVETPLFEVSSAVAGWARIAPGVVRRRSVALLPRF